MWMAIGLVGPSLGGRMTMLTAALTLNQGSHCRQPELSAGAYHHRLTYGRSTISGQ
jgi:hypothetical protein